MGGEGGSSGDVGRQRERYGDRERSDWSGAG